MLTLNHMSQCMTLESRLQELLDKRREALLECLESLKGVYSKPWARTSVDIAVQVRHLSV